MIGLLSQNKKILILATGVGFILLLVPLYFAEAVDIGGWCGCTFLEALNPVCWLKCLAQFLLSLPVRIVFFIIIGLIGLAALVAGFSYVLTVVLVNWLIGVIMSVGIVPGATMTPAIVEMGWDFSRQFANLFFILALAFIGLATVLRIKEYEMKKALPTLIIIALLINFTPVIVGFVVDMGNIVTKFFLDQTGTISALKDLLQSVIDYLNFALPQVFIIDGEFFEKLPFILAVLCCLVIYGIALHIFFLLGTLVYILIGAIFFCRTIILWVLMILSPIAFLSKVFPATRTTKMVFPDILHWDKWWQTLIQWTIVGIPISFFLYLSNLMMTHRREIENKFGLDVLESSLETASSTYAYGLDPAAAAELAPYQEAIINVFTELLAPTIALILLIIGVLISLKAAPEGAKGIMSFTHQQGVQRAWRGIKRIPGGVRGAVDSYHTARGLHPNWTRRAAAWQVIKQETWEKRPWKEGWKEGWPGQRGRVSATTAAEETTTGGTGGGGAAATTGGGTGGGTGATVAEEVGGIIEEASQEDIVSTTPPHPPRPSRRDKVRRAAAKADRGPLRFLITEPGRAGLWAGKGILKAVESTVTKRIDKELRVKGAKDTRETKRTRNCPYCQEKILADSRFCQHCGEELE